MMGRKMVKSMNIFCLLIMLAVSPTRVLAGEVELTRYAGTGEPGEQNGLLLKADFNVPYGLTVDSKGYIYVADSYNNQIRVIANGIVGTVAGAAGAADPYGLPQGGYVDGEVSKARFNRPRAIVLDAQDNIYVADTGNHVIRKISGGKVVTLAGSGKAGYVDGNTRAAQFNTPSGLAIDSGGNLYVADTLNNVIRKITPAGVVTTYAGSKEGIAGRREGTSSQALFNEPSAVAVGKNGDLYVADSGNQLIRRISAGMVETVAGTSTVLLADTTYYQGSYGNGPAASARFNFPKGLAVLDNGTLLLADTWNCRIRAILPDQQVITLAGTGLNGKSAGPVSKAVLGSPVGIVYHNKQIYITDADNHLIWQLPFDPALPQARADFAEASEEIQVWVNGVRMDLTPGAKPYLLKDRTMLPLRAISEALGWRVDWEANGTITLSKEIGQKVFTSADPNFQNKNGLTMVGLRYLAESLGCLVEWVPEYRAVTVSAR